jgi:SAM-dependent methyltransferase
VEACVNARIKRQHCMKNILGKLQLLWLLKSPPALFSRLFNLPWYRKTLEQWVAPLLEPNAKVLEIGCASGDFSRALAALNQEVWAVDRSPKMIAKALQTAGTVRFKKADATQLSFPDQHFDIVLAASLINVVDAPLTVLSEMCRVCRAGGVVSVLVPSLAFTDAEARQLLETEQLTGFSRAAFIGWHRLGKKMEIDVLQGYFKECGLANITTRLLLGGMVVAVYGELCNQI